jgi:hypothetical protein
MPAKKSALLPAVPDFLGKDARIMTVSDLFEQAQHQKLHFSQMMLVNGHASEDAIPQDAPPEGEDAPPVVTYGARLKTLDEGIASLLAANEDIADDLAEEALIRRKKITKARAEAA